MAENVIFGTGALGLAVARLLTSWGKSVRLVNRHGRAAAPAGVEVVAADAADPNAARRACQGASTVFHCAAGSYGLWAQMLPPVMNGIIEGAAAAGAKLVFGDNLYMYGPVAGPIREELPYRPVGPNTRARAEIATTLMNAHAAGSVRATIGRASDFYGPYARTSTAGDSVFKRALIAKPAQVLGNPDLPHTYTFIDDFAAALVVLGQRDEALGQVWHVPSAETVTKRRFVEMVFNHLVRTVRIQQVPRLLITVLGLVSPPMRGVREVFYQQEQPWVVDHGKFARAFGAHPTAHQAAIAQTLDWYKEHLD